MHAVSRQTIEYFNNPGLGTSKKSPACAEACVAVLDREWKVKAHL